MRYIALFLSLLTLVTLISGLFDVNENNREKLDNTKINSFTLPKKLPREVLEFETKWRTIIRNKELNTSESFEVNKSLNNAIKIGGKDYELLGIFDDKSLRFVLLKNEASEILKLKLGSELPGNFKLTEIKHNSIIFKNASDQVEYKLFESKKYDEN